jgi:hypothetical protein
MGLTLPRLDDRLRQLCRDLSSIVSELIITKATTAMSSFSHAVTAPCHCRPRFYGSNYRR